MCFICVQSLFNAEALMHKYEWRAQALVEAYVCDPEGVSASAGIHIGQEEGVTAAEGTVCGICGEPAEEGDRMTELVRLCPGALGHIFCRMCFGRHSLQKLADMGLH